jgi:hypothetical protein
MLVLVFVAILAVVMGQVIIFAAGFVAVGLAPLMDVFIGMHFRHKRKNSPRHFS